MELVGKVAHLKMFQCYKKTTIDIDPQLSIFTAECSDMLSLCRMFSWEEGALSSPRVGAPDVYETNKSAKLT